MKLFFLCLIFISCAHNSKKIESSKKVMGWIEYVTLEDDVFVKGKLDSGAKTSSIHGVDLKNFNKNGKKWLRFTFLDKNEKTQKMVKKVFEKPIVRYVKIKDHKSKSRRRPVVLMDFKIGGAKYSSEFSVTNRKKFMYPVLLGRRFLKDVALIDSSQTFLTQKLKE